MATTQNQTIFLTLPNNDNSTSKREHIAKTFPKKIMLICGILQICCAASAALIQVCNSELEQRNSILSDWNIHKHITIF